MKNRTSKEMIRAYDEACFIPKKHILDNDCSEELKAAIKEKCLLQLVPPGVSTGPTLPRYQ